MDMSFTVHEDNTVSGDVVMAVEEGTGEAFGMSDESVLEEMFADTESQFPGGTVEEYNEDGFVGQRVSFDNQPLEDLGGTDSEMSLIREGDEFVFTGAGAGATDETTDLSQLPGTASVSLTVTFPGEVTETNGTIAEDDPTTVSWDLLTQTEDMNARANATADGGSFPLWIILVVGLGVGVVAGVAIWLGARRKQEILDDAPTQGPADATFTPEQADATTGTAPVAPTDAATTEAATTEAAPVEEAPATEVAADEPGVEEPVVEPVADEAPATEDTTADAAEEAPAASDSVEADSTDEPTATDEPEQK